MKQILQRQLFPAVMAAMFVFTIIPFVDSVMRIYYHQMNAVDWHGVEVITKEVRPGADLEMIYSAVINKQCPSDLRGFLIAPDGTVPVRFPTVIGGYARPTPDPVEIKVKIRIPEHADAGLAPLKDGEYTYRAIATRYCAEGIEYDNKIPDANFEMVILK